jgi:hypothetical protein
MGDGGWANRSFENTPLGGTHSPEEVITIVDPQHPLFGQTFPLIAIIDNQSEGRSCVICLREGIERSVPIEATDRGLEPAATFPVPFNTSSLLQLLTTFERIVCQPAGEVEDEKHERGGHDSLTPGALSVEPGDRRVPDSAGADMGMADPIPAAAGVSGRGASLPPDGSGLPSGGVP